MTLLYQRVKLQQTSSHFIKEAFLLKTTNKFYNYVV